ncbi:MAG: glycosyltransferase family 4 protein [bacterium]|nr:glycosyltransferase family 4 protein [bacterium]
MNTLFAAFDLFPSSKGSTTRIAHTLQALSHCADSMTLATLGHSDMPRFQQEDRLLIRRCLAMHPNFLSRTDLFGDFLFDVLNGLRYTLDVIHFRDIWSGIPLLEHPNTQSAKKVFEMNGIPSIELPVHYPRLYQNSVLTDHLRAMENYCLSQADRIITVSRTSARYLESRNVPAEKIQVIPNIAEIEPDDTPPPPEPLILYAGTLTPWQGVPTLIKAFELIAENRKLRLLLACSSKKFLRPIRKQIKKAGLQEKVDIRIGLPKEELYAYYRQAVCTVVPLTRCDRNELQGCCPLKILESMAVGTPVIASNIAVCRELIEHESDSWLVKPDSPRALAHGILTLLESPELVSHLGQKARQKVRRHNNRERFKEQLRELYQSL